MARISESLNIDEIVEINRQQVIAFGGLFLPYNNNFHNRSSLEYALEAVDGEMFGNVFYPTLESKAAFLAFSIINNHVFHDGNKRTGLMVCRVFLLLNGSDLQLLTDESDEDAMEACANIAKSEINLEQFTEWVRNRMPDSD